MISPMPDRFAMIINLGGLTPPPPISNRILFLPLFTPLKNTYDEYDPSLIYIGDVVVFFRYPPLAFSLWTPSPFVMGLVKSIS